MNDSNPRYVPNCCCDFYGIIEDGIKRYEENLLTRKFNKLEVCREHE